ncbi:MAG: hypothetical protein WBG19_06700 [Thermoplasmata archaeon]
MGLGQIALILGVVALVLGGSALGIVLTKSGPAGSRGPPGSGVQVTHSAYQATQSVPNDTCTAATGSEISFTVTTPGNVTILAAVSVLVVHTTGDAMTYDVTLQSTAASCNALTNDWVEGGVDYSAPTTNYAQQVSLVDTFPVTTAGTYGFEVVGNFFNFYGVDSANYNGISVSAAFYPS